MLIFLPLLANRICFAMCPFKTWKGILAIVKALPEDQRRTWWEQVSERQLDAAGALMVLATLVDEALWMPEDVYDQAG